MREEDEFIVTKLDRLARNTGHLLEIVDKLNAKGITLKILNIGIDTGTPTGKLIGAIATFEREMILERQAEGIAQAKARGLYKRRKPTARSKAEELKELLATGMSKRDVANELGVSESSLYRLLKDISS